MHESLRIIAADTQPEMQQFYAEMLPQMGHQLVGIVETGQSLIQRCQSDRPDLVISDVNLQDMDAVAAAERIAQVAAIPMIILTARKPSSLADQSVTQQLLTFLIKPVNRARLAVEICSAFRRHHTMGGVTSYEGKAGQDRSGHVP